MIAQHGAEGGVLGGVGKEASPFRDDAPLCRRLKPAQVYKTSLPRTPPSAPPLQGSGVRGVELILLLETTNVLRHGVRLTEIPA